MMEFKGLDSKIIDLAVRIPIVYTTKLDEMDAFMTNITDMNVDNVIDSIIKESKPEYNCKRKRKLRSPSHFTYEDLSSYIDAFNSKVARKGEVSKTDLLALCKPVRVVLHDFKKLLRPAPQSIVSKKCLNESMKSSNKSKKCLKENVQNPYLTDWYKPSIKTRPYSSQKSKIIYDTHSKEYDIYSLDNECLIKQYTRIQANNSNSKVYLTFKEDKPFLKVICCCWYNREWYVKCQTKHHRTSMKFMRKQHKCTVDLCHCCCRPKESLSHNTSLQEVTVMDTNTDICEADDSSRTTLIESPSTWFNRIKKKKASGKQLSKLYRVIQAGNKNNDNEKEPFLHTTNIQFGNEYYEIGPDGQIKFFYKGVDKDGCPYLMPPSVNSIIGENICCWYKLENFAVRLLELGALQNSVNFLRFPHPCSVTNCSCCCKPKPDNNTQLVILPVTVRYTNNFNNTKVNSEIESEKITDTKIESNVSRKTDNRASFNISLKAINTLSNTTDTALIQDVLNEVMPETDALDKNNIVRFIINKSGPQCKTVVEGVDLSSMTRKELRILDIVFYTIENSLPEECRPIATKPKARQLKTIQQHKPEPRPLKEKLNLCQCRTNPSLHLNEEVSRITDLRYKRFLPSLRDHLKIIKFPNLKDISEWSDSPTTQISE